MKIGERRFAICDLRVTRTFFGKITFQFGSMSPKSTVVELLRKKVVDGQRFSLANAAFRFSLLYREEEFQGIQAYIYSVWMNHLIVL